MPRFSFLSPTSPPQARRVPPHSGDDAEERLIPFPARSNAEPAPAQRRRREVRDLERGNAPRRVRRRRQDSTPWLQRNALSVAAVSILVALLGLGFGMLQTLNNHSDTSPSLLALGQNEPSAVSAGLVGNGVLQNASASSAVPTVEARREIESTAKVLEPSYTVESGDTLGRIAVRFSTSVERIQALNNLADPKTLRIGTKLVIPPPL